LKEEKEAEEAKKTLSAAGNDDTKEVKKGKKSVRPLSEKNKVKAEQKVADSESTTPKKTVKKPKSKK